MKKIKVKLKDGTFVMGDSFNKRDYNKLKSIFKKWLDINKSLKSLNGRALNVPDVFSEGLFCIFFNAVRTNSIRGSHSYDCILIESGEGVQIKSGSIALDCTSFGPKSTWDLFYYIDFAPNGSVDGNVYFYEIDTSDIYGLVLNKEKNETFKDQQEQGRRPRFSMKSRVIQSKGIEPVLKINLLD